MLRVLFLSPEFRDLTKAGGIGSFTASLSGGLAERGHQVEVIVCDAGLDRADLDLDGVGAHVRPTARYLPDRLRLNPALTCFLEYRRLGRRFDVVVAPDWGGLGILFALRRHPGLVVRLATPLWVIRRLEGVELSRGERWASALERAAALGAVGLASPSELLAGMVHEDRWLKGRPIHVVPTPVAVSAWEGLPLPGDAPLTVLAIGRVDSLKGADTLLEAAKLLHAEFPSLRVVFAGRHGNLHGRAAAEVIGVHGERAGVPCSVTGDLDAPSLRDVLGQSRLVVVASRYDNFPNSGLEGLAGARPVVCTNATGLAPLVAEVDPSLVVPPENPRAMADAIRPFLVDASLADDVGRRGQSLVRDRHGLGPTAVEWETFLAGVAGKASAR